MRTQIGMGLWVIGCLTGCPSQPQGAQDGAGSGRADAGRVGREPDDDRPPVVRFGEVSGKVTVFTPAGEKSVGAQSSGLVFGAPAASEAPIKTASRNFGSKPLERIVLGEVLVKSKSSITAAAMLEVIAPSTTGFNCRHAGFAAPLWHRVECSKAGQALSESQTQALVKRIETQPEISACETDGIAYTQAVPNDPEYVRQWHYPAMGLPLTWDLQVGVASVVVAVVDTGIVAHEDLDDNVLPGYDFVTEAKNAKDGDGRDANPTDEGGESGKPWSWHGSHVAGTISAKTHNTIGVAGVAGNVKLLPVRVLGSRGYGTNSDIAAGVLWAIGGDVPGVPRNPNPASVVNMSIGGDGAPSRLYQDVFDLAAQKGAIVVIAAGNEAEDTTNKSPCNHANVICVGSVDFAGKPAPYSNQGKEVTVMAPGGDKSVDLNGDGSPDGVLSTVKGGYAYLEGTSMASPHVAGVVALMKSFDSSLSYAAIRSALQRGSLAMKDCGGCGAGRLMANLALAEVKKGVPAAAQLIATPSTLVLTPSKASDVVTLSNIGNQTAEFKYSTSSGEAEAIELGDGAVDRLEPWDTFKLTLKVNFSKLKNKEGDFDVQLLPKDGDQTPLATIILKVREERKPPPPAAVALLAQDDKEEWVVVAQTVADASGAYSLKAPAGEYLLLAVVDSNSNGKFEQDEPLGAWPTSESWKPFEVVAGRKKTNVNFSAAPK